MPLLAFLQGEEKSNPYLSSQILLGRLTLYETRTKSIIAIALSDRYLIRHSSEHFWRIAEHLKKMDIVLVGDGDRPGFLEFCHSTHLDPEHQPVGTPALELWRAWRRSSRQRSRMEFSIMKNKKWNNVVEITFNEGNLYLETDEDISIVGSEEVMVWSQPT
ncbi:MAG: hypothetical protein HC772_07710 [Leptolyngbyaceae cyanobacterium CRU_2_3]|nr:hypothetical protein [Leptolyngbyaceae cyanobacterium CRU_2_3]